MSTRSTSMRRTVALLVMGVVAGLSIPAGRHVIAQDTGTTPETPTEDEDRTPNTPTDARTVKLCFDLPAIGNTESVKKWRYGRIESIQRRGSDDLDMQIRGVDGNTHRVMCPAQPFAALAERSHWMGTSDMQFPSRRDWVERMVAFDADETGRVIALTSLEPMARRPGRIADAHNSRPGRRR